MRLAEGANQKGSLSTARRECQPPDHHDGSGVGDREVSDGQLIRPGAQGPTSVGGIKGINYRITVWFQAHFRSSTKQRLSMLGDY